MTHEEVITSIARTKFARTSNCHRFVSDSDQVSCEPRPKSGLMRLAPFIMKDAYSFDVDWKDSIHRLRTSAKLTNAFSRVRIQFFRSSKRRSGSMGGSESNEFVAKTDAGED